MRKHPMVEFMRFGSLLFLACSINHPVALAFFFLTSLVLLKPIGWKWYGGMFFTVLITMTVNVLTNHRGETYLCYMNDNIITLESIVYGGVLGLQIVILINICMAMSKAMTSEKVVVVTSYLSPSLALLLSMSIRSANRYKNKLTEIFRYQKSEAPKQDCLSMILIAIRSVSILVNWSLENGIETAESMRCRGYGSGRRSNYVPIRFIGKDLIEIIIVLIITVVIKLKEPWYLFSPRIEIEQSIFFSLLLIGFVIYQIEECLRERSYQKENNSK